MAIFFCFWVQRRREPANPLAFAIAPNRLFAPSSLEFKEKMVEAIAEACVQAAGKLISALDREPEA